MGFIDIPYGKTYHRINVSERTRKEGTIMPVMDEFREEREAIKNASFPEKLKYFWSYYKWHTICTILGVTLLVILVRDILIQKDDAFFCALLNAAVPDQEQTEIFHNDFVEYAGIDVKEFDVRFDSTLTFNQGVGTEFAMSASQRLLVYTAAGELDVIVGNSEIFPEEANQGMFFDLREILTEEQLAKYEPYFYYVDQALIDEWDLISQEGSITAEYPLPPDPTKPEEMEQPIPVALFVTDCEKLTDVYYFPGDYVAVGVMVNAPNPENGVKFIDYLFE